MSGKKGGDKSLVLSEGQYEALKKVHPALVGPVTIERAANYFMESFNEQVGNGVDPKLAWARSLNYAIPASVIDGIGMSAAPSEQIPF